MSETTTRTAPTGLLGNTVATPALHHWGTATTRHEEMIEWYRDVLGLEIVAQTSDPLPKMTFVANDEHHHRGGFFSPPGLEDDPDRLAQSRIQHLAWEYDSIETLLETWQRLVSLGIEPVSCCCHGPSFAFYYKDPDRNTVELLTDAYADHARSFEHTTRPEWRAKPNGVAVDPQALIDATAAGVSLDELRENGLAGRYLPAVEPSPMSTW